jgi:endonuclease YncB( thermonuclease family)
LAEVILPDGRNLNHELVKAGLGWWFRKYAPHDEELEQLEKEARAAKRGLWSDPHANLPWEFRKQGSEVSRVR